MESGRDIRILLVDDDPSDIERTMEVLRKRCLASAVRIARGGQEALDYLFGRGQFAARRRYPIPDLVLLDLNMPGTDGFAVLAQMRKAQAVRRMPVIALCTTKDEGERATHCEFRANQYIVKPVTFDSFADIAQQIENWTLRLDLPDRYAASSPECTTNPPCSLIAWNSIFGQISLAAFSSSGCP
jgi:two-component system response regulator